MYKVEIKLTNNKFIKGDFDNVVIVNHETVYRPFAYYEHSEGTHVALYGKKKVLFGTKEIHQLIPMRQIDSISIIVDNENNR